MVPIIQWNMVRTRQGHSSIVVGTKKTGLDRGDGWRPYESEIYIYGISRDRVGAERVEEPKLEVRSSTFHRINIGTARLQVPTQKPGSYDSARRKETVMHSACIDRYVKIYSVHS